MTVCNKSAVAGCAECGLVIRDYARLRVLRGGAESAVGLVCLPPLLPFPHPWNHSGVYCLSSRFLSDSYELDWVENIVRQNYVSARGTKFLLGTTLSCSERARIRIVATIKVWFSFF